MIPLIEYNTPVILLKGASLMRFQAAKLLIDEIPYLPARRYNSLFIVRRYYSINRNVEIFTVRKFAFMKFSHCSYIQCFECIC